MAVPTMAPPSRAPDLGQGSSTAGQLPPRTPYELSRRRFTRAVLIGMGLMAIPMLYLLWDLWSGSPNPLRGVPYDNFYDLQARAMFHGHLNLAHGRDGHRGLPPRRAVLHLLRHLSLVDPDAHLGGHQLVRRRSDRRVTPGGLDHDRSVLLADAVATAGPDAGARSGGSHRGRGLRGVHGHGHGRIGDHLPHRHPVHLQRGLRLEHPTHRGRPVRHDRGHGAPIVGRVWASFAPGALRQPQPHPDRLRLHHRSRPDRRLAVPGPGRAGQPPMGLAHAGGGGHTVPDQLRGDLRQVRPARGVAHGRPGMGHGQRPPALLPGRQRRQGLQLGLPAQHRGGLPAAVRHPLHRGVPLHHATHLAGGLVRRLGDWTRPIPPPA